MPLPESSTRIDTQPDGPARDQASAVAPRAARPTAVESTHLFRPEVLAERRAQWLGTVLLAPRASHRLFAVFAVLVVMAVAALLILADFTRKAKVSGLLVPHEGMVRVFAPRPGVVTDLYVKEGQEIRKGDRLLALSAELQSATLGATQAEIARRLADRRRSLLEERSQQERLLAQQQRTLADRIAALRSEEAGIEREIAVLKARVEVAERAEQLNRKLSEQGFISAMRLQLVESETLEQRTRTATVERNRIAIQRERMTLEGELRDLPLKSRNEIANLERSAALLEQEMAEAEARREIVVPAPQDGTVTAILAELGGNANVAVPLLSIVPRGASLEAHLYSPSRAVGFVRPGQRVLLRYQAYPYQKFGHYDGVVASVSRSAVSPSELPPQLGGVTIVPGANAGEPVYRITVKLSRQTVSAYGQDVPLQPGIQLDADVTLETRRLYEWLLDPIYTVTGKWQG